MLRSKQHSAGVVQAQAAINAAKAGIAAVSPELDRALTELHRQQALFDTKAATHQQLEAATAQEGQLSGVLAGAQSGPCARGGSPRHKSESTRGCQAPARGAQHKG